MTIRDILIELGIPFVNPGEHKHVTSNFYGIDCPYCSPGSLKYKLGIAVNGRGASCWSCGSHSLSEVLSKAANRTERDLRPLLAKVELDYSKPIRTPLRGILTRPDGIGEFLPAHKRYLERRGFDPQWISEHYGVRGIGLAAKLAWSLYIPIAHQGREVSWTTRSLTDKGRRYWSAKPDQEVIAHKRLLYGSDFVGSTVIVVEGPIDVWAIGDGATCTFGSGYSQAQVAAISKYPIRVVVLDSEPEAQHQARKLCQMLSTFPGTTYQVELTTGKDTASSSREEVKELRKKFLS